MTPAEKLAIRLEADRARYLRSRKEPPRAEVSHRASQLGHPCERHLVLMRTRGDARPMVSDTTQSIFEEGKHHELSVRKVLAEMGYDLQAAQMGFPANNYGITGHIDGALLEDGSMVVVEAKGVNDHDWNRIAAQGVDYIRDARRTWLSKWYLQLQLYMYLAGVEDAVWILKSKQTGQWFCLPVQLDYKLVQDALDRLERVNAHLSAGTLPVFHDEPEVCEQCPFFGRVCAPPLAWDDAAFVFDDREDTPEVFRRWAELNAAVGDRAKELRRLEGMIRGYVRRRVRSNKRLMVGDVVVAVKVESREGHYVAPSESVRITLKGKNNADSVEPEEIGEDR